MTTQRRQKLSGVYAITDAALTPAQSMRGQVEQALLGGVRIVQYRDKSADSKRRLEQARELVSLCRAYEALLIVNDDVELVEAIDADGVHVGREDAALREARARLGNERIIGVSCYDSLERAERAVAGRADYVAFGSFFASSIKPHAVRPPVSLLAEASQRWSIPVCAIGGINAGNAAALIAGGADMLAVISALFGGADPRAAARELCDLFP